MLQGSSLLGCTLLRVLCSLLLYVCFVSYPRAALSVSINYSSTGHVVSHYRPFQFSMVLVHALFTSSVSSVCVRSLRRRTCMASALFRAAQIFAAGRWSFCCHTSWLWKMLLAQSGSRHWKAQGKVTCLFMNLLSPLSLRNRMSNKAYQAGAARCPSELNDVFQMLQGTRLQGKFAVLLHCLSPACIFNPRCSYQSF